MADKRLNIAFDASMNIEQVMSAIQKMQQELNKVKIPQSIGNQLNSTFSSLVAEVNNFKTLTGGGIIDSTKDYEKLASSGEKILKLYEQLNKQASGLGGLSKSQLEQLFPSSVADNIKKANDLIKQYEASVKAATGQLPKMEKEIDKTTKATEKLKRQHDELSKRQVISDSTFKQMTKEAEQAEKASAQAIAAVEEYKKKVQEKENQLTKNGQNPGNANRSSTYRDMVKELRQLEEAAQKAQIQYEKLKKKRDNALTQGTKDKTLEELNAKLNEAQQKLAELKKQYELLKTGNQPAFQELINQLNQIQGIKLDSATASMEQVKAAVQGLSDEAFQKLIGGFSNINNAVEGSHSAFIQFIEALRGTKKQVYETDAAFNDINALKSRVQYFFSAVNAINLFKRTLRSAVNTVKELDAAMTETAVVTDFSIGDMWEKLPEYSAQATQLGTSIKSLYEATTLYYQQGLNSQQAMDIGIETMKMARIANMDAAAATEAMTAALRGFNMEINETSAGRINDVYSKLAAITASDTEQIATAMSKTASIASSANMEFETTAALLAQIIETTQEAPETAGTAMKTIIARFTEVKQLFSEGMLTGEDGEGEEININKIDAALKTVGISLKDFLNGSKGIDDIFLELASKWNSLDLATQRYIATTAAGSRQQSRFIAMMSNYERTIELVEAANNSAGASQKQFGKTLDSLEAKLQRLSNAWNTFVMGLADNQLIKQGVDLLTNLLETINNLTSNLGGTIGGIAKLGIAITGLKIGKNIFNSIFNLTPLKQNVSQATGISKIFAQTLIKTGVKIKTETKENIDAASASITKFTGGLMMAGLACGALAQYLRSMGMEDFAKGLEIAGGALITVASGINLVNSIAVAAGTTVPALLSSRGKIP